MVKKALNYVSAQAAGLEPESLYRNFQLRYPTSTGVL